MTDRTTRHYLQLVRRFEAFAAVGSNEARARAFLASLTPAMGHSGHQALHWAHPEWDWPTIPKPRVRRNVARLKQSVMGPGDLERFRASLKSARDRAITECFFLLRRFETAARRWEDFDFQDGTVSFIGKGDRPRWAPLPIRTLTALAAWYVESGCPEPKAPVFPGQIAGQPISPGRLSNLVRQLLRKAGLYRPGRGPHAWRRTFARAFLESNPSDLLGLKDALGHADVSTTQDYVFFLPDDLRPRLDRVRL